MSNQFVFLFTTSPFGRISTYSCLAEFSYRKHLNNPCSDAMKDFFIMRSSEDKEYNSFGKLRARGKSLERVDGCCSALVPILGTQNLKLIMDLMKFSIGTTIPQSPKYNKYPLEMSSKAFPLFQPPSRLKRMIENRYFQYILSFFIFFLQ